MKINSALLILIIFWGCFAGAAQKEQSPDACVLDCELLNLEKYLPSKEIIEKLELLFSPELRNRITDLGKDLKNYLIKNGFHILQYPYSSKSAVVVEHPLLEGYVLKFARNPQAAVVGTFKKELQITKKRSLAFRAINADKLNTFIQKYHLKYIRVPKKFFYCVDHFPLLLAQKVSTQSRRSFKDLNEHEIREMLLLVQLSKGILDLAPRNIILSDKHILFIDTERQEEPLVWPSLILDSVKEFRHAVDVRYKTLIEDWFAQFLLPDEDWLEPATEDDPKKAVKDLETAVKAEKIDTLERLFQKHTYKTKTLNKQMFKAVESGNLATVGLLLEHGADPNTINSRGTTLFDFAQEQENPAMIKLLKSYEE